MLSLHPSSWWIYVYPKFFLQWCRRKEQPPLKVLCLLLRLYCIYNDRSCLLSAFADFQQRDIRNLKFFWPLHNFYLLPALPVQYQLHNLYFDFYFVIEMRLWHILVYKSFIYRQSSSRIVLL